MRLIPQDLCLTSRVSRIYVLVPVLFLLSACSQTAQVNTPARPATPVVEEKGDEVTYRTPEGVTIVIAQQDEKIEKYKEDNVGVQQQLNVLTYTLNRTSWQGPRRLYTSLRNNSRVTGDVSIQVIQSASGQVTGGISHKEITASINFNASISRTFTVTAKDVKPGQSVNIYIHPVGTKFFGYQRIGPSTYSWAQCNANPGVCGPLSSWTAISPEGFGWTFN